MPPVGSAGKKSQQKKAQAQAARDARQSRNTTPNSTVVVSIPALNVSQTFTPLLNIDTSKLLVASQPTYADILDRLETKPSNLEPRSLNSIIEELRDLTDAAETRVETCENAIRTIHEQLKDIEFEQRERDREAEQHSRSKSKKNESKTVKAKKRKDRDTIEVKVERDDDFKSRLSSTPGPTDSPSPSKKIKASPGSSSLSDVASPKPKAEDRASPAASDTSMEENKIVKKPPAVPVGGFFPNPLAPDPIRYHIPPITSGMSEDEKKKIFSVTSYPTVDLSHEIAGTPPDKDFSNARPQNQIAANTFLSFVEAYTRPLAEEDMAFLRERGDRTVPFMSIPRSKRTWREKWAEEEETMLVEHKLPANQARGTVEDIEDENLTTDEISNPPLASRLLSLLKFEHRSPLNEVNGNVDLNAFTGGDDTMDLDGFMNGIENERPVAPAAAVAELSGSRSFQKIDYVQSDERIKAELRYLGLLGQEESPDYDSHNDDDISERLRLLQAELRKVMVVNGARKQRLLDLAKERLAYQEYRTIHDDLDSQVQQAYLKRTRTLGKTKKGGPGANKLKPGTAMNFALNRARDIGDNARMLMDRRRRWQNSIGPVFKDMKHGIPTKDETIWEPKFMESYEKAELEAMEEEGE